MNIYVRKHTLPLIRTEEEYEYADYEAEHQADDEEFVIEVESDSDDVQLIEKYVDEYCIDEVPGYKPHSCDYYGSRREHGIIVASVRIDVSVWERLEKSREMLDSAEKTR